MRFAIHHNAHNAGSVLAALLLLAASSPLLAQQVTVTAQPTAVTVDDEVHLEVRATGDFDELVPPATPGFVVTGRSQSSQFSIVGSQMSREQVLSMSLEPSSAGALTIGAAELRRGGRVVARSEPVVVTVREISDRAVRPEATRNLNTHAGEPFFLLPTLPERPVYVGEPFVLSYELYVRGDVRVQGASWKRAPDLSGFSVEDLIAGDKPRPRRRRIAGRVYSVLVQSRDLVVPLTPGNVRLGAATMEVTAGDLFNRRRYKVRVPAVDVEVRPIPKEGRPAGFRDGNLGRYTLAVEVRPARVRAGERVVLTLRISGEGHVEALKAPEPPELPGAEVETLPASDSDRVEKTVAGVSGTRVFQWIIVPRQEGELAVPALEFAYFDPVAGEFEVATTEPLTVAVEGIAPVATNAVRAAATEREMRDIRAESDLLSHRAEALPDTLWYWPLLVALGLAVLGVEVVTALLRRRERNAERIRKRGARGQAEKRLRAAAEHVGSGETEAFYREVAETLNAYAESRFGLVLRGGTHGAVRLRLLTLGADDELAEGLIAEMENCDYARFAPVSVREDEMKRSLERVRDFVARLDRLKPAAGEAQA